MTRNAEFPHQKNIKRRVEFFRHPGLDAGGEAALVQLELGPIESNSEQRIAELVGVARIEGFGLEADIAAIVA